MKKLLLATTALFALAGGSANAADLPPAYKAPPPPPVVYSWTGCYVGVGGGYGMWNQELYGLSDPGRVPFTSTQTQGGRGWLGTVQVGCDYQVGSSFVIGAFADYDWTNIKGNVTIPAQANFIGEEKQKSAWAVGGRIGWLPFERLMTFFSAGYTQARFDRINYSFAVFPFTDANLNFPAQTYSGWFVGSGYEYVLGWLPGLTWKTEYRFASYRDRTDSILTTSTGAIAGEALNSKKYVQTIRSELVWRFGGGAVTARY